MDGKRLEQVVRDALGIVEDGVDIGELCPSDVPEVVEAVCQKYLQGLQRVQATEIFHALLPENQAYIRSRMFHSFSDFLLTLRHETPKKGDYISPGYSLDRYTPDLAGYLAYLEKAAPDLARFFFRRMAARIPEGARKKLRLKQQVQHLCPDWEGLLQWEDDTGT